MIGSSNLVNLGSIWNGSARVYQYNTRPKYIDITCATQRLW
jgi:hypothetical protein